MSDNARSLFEELRTIYDVQRLIDLAQEENLYLDYKQASFSNDKLRADDVDNLAKALSGFANTEGGVLIWGIKTGDTQATEDIPESIVPLSNIEGFRQALESSLATRVIPAVQGILFNALETSEGSNQGVLVMLVPESIFKPHMAYGKGDDTRYCYYRRISGNFKRMEHSEVEALFARRYKLADVPKVVIQPQYRTSDRLVLVAANLGSSAAVNIDVDVEVRRSGVPIRNYKWLEPILLTNQSLTLDVPIISENPPSQSGENTGDSEVDSESNLVSEDSKLFGNPDSVFFTGYYENAHGEKYPLQQELDLSVSPKNKTVRYIRQRSSVDSIGRLETALQKLRDETHKVSEAIKESNKNSRAISDNIKSLKK